MLTFGGGYYTIIRQKQRMICGCVPRTENKMGRASVFENRKWVPLFAGSAALSWACAFPLIKLGLADFGIAGTDTGGKALFAGARFLLAGLVVLAVAKLCGRSFAVPRGKTRWQLVLFGLVNTALHYFFFYLGVSNSPGGRASILDSLGTFLLILAALVAVSAVGFSFYNQLLRYHPVGQIAIYNAFIPVLGVVLSCLLLGEPFSWRYLLSGALVTVGICAVNLPGKGKN